MYITLYRFCVLYNIAIYITQSTIKYRICFNMYSCTKEYIEIKGFCRRILYLWMAWKSKCAAYLINAICFWKQRSYLVHNTVRPHIVNSVNSGITCSITFYDKFSSLISGIVLVLYTLYYKPTINNKSTSCTHSLFPFKTINRAKS